MFQYYIPESRSKRLAKAVDLARKVTGFEDLDEGYRVSPTPLEIAEPTFSKLLELSEKWKGSAFLINGEEVDKSTFLERAAEAAASRVEETKEPDRTRETPVVDEPEPKSVEQEAPEQSDSERPTEQKSEPPSPVDEKVIEQPERPQQEAVHEQPRFAPPQESTEEPAEPEESPPKVVPATSSQPQITPEPKKGCCCFGPLGLVAIVLIILSQFW